LNPFITRAPLASMQMADRLTASWLALALLVASPAQAAGGMTEVQINLCSPVADVQAALGLEPRGAPTRVWLLDTPSGDLHRQGVRIRVRDSGKAVELTVKAAGVDCARMDAAALGARGKCESDLHGNESEQVASVNSRMHLAPFLTEPAGSGPAARASALAALDAALTREQRALLATRPGLSQLPADLALLGPSQLVSYRAGKAGPVLDHWVLPGGEHFLELSERVPSAGAPGRRDQLLEGLQRAGVRACADQRSTAGGKLAALLRHRAPK
jgi:hypothetical protein